MREKGREEERGQTWRNLEDKPTLTISKEQESHIQTTHTHRITRTHKHFTKLLEGNKMKFLEITWTVGDSKKKVWCTEWQEGIFTTWKAGEKELVFPEEKQEETILIPQNVLLHILEETIREQFLFTVLANMTSPLFAQVSEDWGIFTKIRKDQPVARGK